MWSLPEYGWDVVFVFDAAGLVDSFVAVTCVGAVEWEE